MAEIDRLAYEYYQAPGVAEGWSRAAGLLPTEELLLDEFAPVLANARVLDIGVGPGRTTPGISSRCRHYIGIDYAERMLLPCRSRFPDADLLLCDARRLAFRNEAFDVVLFLYNALDDACHADRLAILSDIKRVLRVGGLLMFACHNTDGGIYPPQNATDLVNHLAKKQLEVRTQDYSILNDSSSHYTLLTYYMTAEQQVRQLWQGGFARASARGLDGRELRPGETSKDRSLHYIAWKDSD